MKFWKKNIICDDFEAHYMYLDMKFISYNDVS
jgi:hypothetical protein